MASFTTIRPMFVKIPRIRKVLEVLILSIQASHAAEGETVPLKFSVRGMVRRKKNRRKNKEKEGKIKTNSKIAHQQ